MEKTKSQTSSRYGFSWWIKNLLIAALAYMLLPGFVKSNAGYEWLIEGYAKGNLKVIKQYDNLNNDQKLEMKLGYDYAFIEMIRRMTPEDAVIYYPSRKDFTAEPDNVLRKPVRQALGGALSLPAPSGDRSRKGKDPLGKEDKPCGGG